MRVVALTAVPALFVLQLAAQRPAAAAADLRSAIEQWNADRALLDRRYDSPLSAVGRERRAEFHRAVCERLRTAGAPADRDGLVDWFLLQGHAERALRAVEQTARDDEEALAVLAFAAPLVRLHERWRDLDDFDPAAAAATLGEAANGVRDAGAAAEAGKHDALPPHRGKVVLERLDALRRALGEWFAFHDGYHPEFSWWCRRPWQQLDGALTDLRQNLQRRLVDRAGDSSLIGNPIGREALERELGFEWIPYAPAELIAIAEREFAWCDAEMDAAAKAMGCADWRQALERVKQRHRRPGEQPAMIRALAQEAIDFLRERDLVTIPELAGHGWRMSMMAAEAQRVNPFFLGGEVIQVSFPTDAMEHDQKLQSLRSNNEHFCRATVHHELIPGHWLQQYSQARHRPYRRAFSTPFWIEGWALYWEMRMYELGLAKTPEDRVGMLYWRKHRCARIVFSLSYHLGEWDARRCIDYLVERVGHEPAAAEGEVRRSLTGGYGPLYQAAYMLGGLQFRALHRELVASGRMAERSFHDAVLQHNSIPVALVRLALRPDLDAAAFAKGWRFADAEPAAAR